jgi:hypothetical protein
VRDPDPLTACARYIYLALADRSPSRAFSKVEKVDQTMDSIREQMDLTNEISDAISNPVGMGNMVDEVGPVPCGAVWRILLYSLSC